MRKAHCVPCSLSLFCNSWEQHLTKLRVVYQERFGKRPDDQLILDAAHKKAVEEYQDKGFNV